MNRPDKADKNGRKRTTNNPHATRSNGSAKNTSKAGQPVKPSKPVKPAPSAKTPRTTPLAVTEPAGLLAFLLEKLTNTGRNSVKSLLAHGQISVNGRPTTKFDFPLKPGMDVTVHWQREAERPPLAGIRILHEDEDFIVIEKEAGLLSIATEQENELTAYRQLNDYVRAENPQARVFIVHRLDRDTSGVMLFAKKESVRDALQENWKDNVEERTYIALVEGEVKRPEGTIQSWLKETRTLKMYSSPHAGDGLLAITHYKVIQKSRDYSLLEVRLETGRKNQIRVHLSDIGHPIVGDKKYGSRSNTIGRLGLHARTLSFRHPLMEDRQLSFTAEPPRVFTRPFREQQV